MRLAIRWALSVAVAAGCGAARAPGPEPGVAPRHDGPVARATPDVRHAAYALYWAGQRVGEAREQLTADRFVRRERIAIRRGEAVVELGTEIDVELGPGMRARRVVVTRTSGSARVTGRAVRQDGRWRVVNDVDDHSERPQWLDGEAIPVELVPWVLGQTKGALPEEMQVLLSGHGFATADLYVRLMKTAPNRLLAVLALPGGQLTSEITLDEHGEPLAIASDGGLESRRVAPDELYAAFDPPELVEAAAISVAGSPPRGAFVRLVLDGVAAPPPPPLPGQVVRSLDRTWHVTLTAGLGVADADGLLSGRAPNSASDAVRDIADDVISDAGARTPMEELRALARYTDRALADDLGSPTVDARGALAMGRGDCKAHTAVFAELASARGFEVALVTGYRLIDEPTRLARHRWALVRLGPRWLAVDPTYGEVPAAPRLLGLATHDAARDLPLADEVAFAGFANATARLE